MSEWSQAGQIRIPSIDATAEQVSQGSVQQLLKANLGREVVAEFWVGAEDMVRKAGTLSAVSTDYLVLYDDVNLVDIVCDVYALRFITFYLPGARPNANNGQSGSGSGADGSASAAESARSGGAQSGAAGTGEPVEPVEPRGVTPVTMAARTQAQAALNYAKRKARKLD